MRVPRTRHRKPIPAEDRTVKKMLFSGRFDPPNPGHIATIQRLGKQYACVYVVVLNHPEQQDPVQLRVAILKEILDNSKGEYVVIANDSNFETIARDDVSGLDIDFDVYGSGNRQCLKNMEQLGYAVEFVPRAYHYKSTEYRLAQKIQNLFGGA